MRLFESLWSTSERSERGDHSLLWGKSPSFYFLVILGSKKLAILVGFYFYVTRVQKTSNFGGNYFYVTRVQKLAILVGFSFSVTRVQKTSNFGGILLLLYQGPRNQQFWWEFTSTLQGYKKLAILVGFAFTLLRSKKLAILVGTYFYVTRVQKTSNFGGICFYTTRVQETSNFGGILLLCYNPTQHILRKSGFARSARSTTAYGPLLRFSLRTPLLRYLCMILQS